MDRDTGSGVVTATLVDSTLYDISDIGTSLSLPLGTVPVISITAATITATGVEFSLARTGDNTDALDNVMVDIASPGGFAATTGEQAVTFNAGSSTATLTVMPASEASSDTVTATVVPAATDVPGTAIYWIDETLDSGSVELIPEFGVSSVSLSADNVEVAISRTDSMPFDFTVDVAVAITSPNSYVSTDTGSVSFGTGGGLKVLLLALEGSRDQNLGDTVTASIEEGEGYTISQSAASGSVTIAGALPQFELSRLYTEDAFAYREEGGAEGIISEGRVFAQVRRTNSTTSVAEVTLNIVSASNTDGDSSTDPYTTDTTVTASFGAGETSLVLELERHDDFGAGDVDTMTVSIASDTGYGISGGSRQVHVAFQTIVSHRGTPSLENRIKPDGTMGLVFVFPFERLGNNMNPFIVSVNVKVATSTAPDPYIKPDGSNSSRCDTSRCFTTGVRFKQDTTTAELVLPYNNDVQTGSRYNITLSATINSEPAIYAISGAALVEHEEQEGYRTDVYIGNFIIDGEGISLQLLRPPLREGFTNDNNAIMARVNINSPNGYIHADDRGEHTVEFEADEYSKTITLDRADDAMVGPGEDLTATVLPSTDNSYFLGTSPTTRTLALTDLKPAINVAMEYFTGANNVQVTVSRAGSNMTALATNTIIVHITDTSDYLVVGSNHLVLMGELALDEMSSSQNTTAFLRSIIAPDAPGDLITATVQESEAYLVGPQSAYTIYLQGDGTVQRPTDAIISLDTVGVCEDDATRICITVNRTASAQALSRASLRVPLSVSGTNLGDYIDTGFGELATIDTDVTFAASATTATKRFIRRDSSVTPGVMVTVAIQTDSAYVTGSPGTATFELTDYRPTFELGPARVADNNGVDSFEFDIIRRGSNTDNVSVTLSLSSSDSENSHYFKLLPGEDDSTMASFPITQDITTVSLTRTGVSRASPARGDTVTISIVEDNTQYLVSRTADTISGKVTDARPSFEITAATEIAADTEGGPGVAVNLRRAMTTTNSRAADVTVVLSSYSTGLRLTRVVSFAAVADLSIAQTESITFHADNFGSIATTGGALVVSIADPDPVTGTYYSAGDPHGVDYTGTVTTPEQTVNITSFGSCFSDPEQLCISFSRTASGTALTAPFTLAGSNLPMLPDVSPPHTVLANFLGSFGSIESKERELPPRTKLLPSGFTDISNGTTWASNVYFEAGRTTATVMIPRHLRPLVDAPNIDNPNKIKERYVYNININLAASVTAVAGEVISGTTGSYTLTDYLPAFSVAPITEDTSNNQLTATINRGGSNTGRATLRLSVAAITVDQYMSNALNAPSCPDGEPCNLPESIFERTLPVSMGATEASLTISRYELGNIGTTTGGWVRISIVGDDSYATSGTASRDLQIAAPEGTQLPQFLVQRVYSNDQPGDEYGNIMVRIQRLSGTAAATLNLAIDSPAGYSPTTHTVNFPLGLVNDALTASIARLMGVDDHGPGDTITISIAPDDDFSDANSYMVSGRSRQLELIDFKPAFSIVGISPGDDSVVITLRRVGSNESVATVTLEVMAGTMAVMPGSAAPTVDFPEGEMGQVVSLVIARSDLGTVGTAGGELSATIMADDDAYLVGSTNIMSVTISAPEQEQTLPAFAITGISASDSDPVVVTVARTDSSTTAATVDVSYTYGGGYFTGGTGTIEFTTSDTTGTLEIDRVNDGNTIGSGTRLLVDIRPTSNAGSYTVPDSGEGVERGLDVIDVKPGFSISAGTVDASNVSFTVTRAGSNLAAVTTVTFTVTAGATTVDPAPTVTFPLGTTGLGGNHDPENGNPQTVTLTVARSALGTVGTGGGDVTATIATATAYNIVSSPGNSATLTIPAPDTEVSVSGVNNCSFDGSPYLCLQFSRPEASAAGPLPGVSFTVAGTGLATYLVAPAEFDTTTNPASWAGSVDFAAGFENAEARIARVPGSITTSALDITVTVTDGSAYNVGGSPATFSLTDARPTFSITEGEVTATAVTFTLTRTGSNTDVANINVEVTASRGHVASGPQTVEFAQSATGTEQTLTLDRISTVVAGEVTATIVADVGNTYNIASGNTATHNIGAATSPVRVSAVAICEDDDEQLCLGFTRSGDITEALTGTGVTLTGVNLASYLTLPSGFTETNASTWTGSVDFGENSGEAAIRVARKLDGFAPTALDLFVTVENSNMRGIDTPLVDFKPTFRISVGATDASSITFVVTRIGSNTAAMANVDVEVTAMGGHATASMETVVFSPRENTDNFTVTRVAGITVAGSVTATIVSDDDPGTMSVDESTYNIATAASSATHDISLLGMAVDICESGGIADRAICMHFTRADTSVAGGFVDLGITMTGTAPLANYLNINSFWTETNANTWTFNYQSLFGSTSLTAQRGVSRKSDNINPIPLSLTVTATGAQGPSNVGPPDVDFSLPDFKPAFSITAGTADDSNVTFTITRAGSNLVPAMVNFTGMAGSEDVTIEPLTFPVGTTGEGGNHDPGNNSPQTATLTIARSALGTTGTAGGEVSVTIAVNDAYNIADSPANMATQTISAVVAGELPEISISDGTVNGTTVTFPIESTAMPSSALTVNVTITGPEALVPTGSADVMATIEDTGTEGTITYMLPNAAHPGGTLTATLQDDTAFPATYEVSDTEASVELVVANTLPVVSSSRTGVMGRIATFEITSTPMPMSTLTVHATITGPEALVPTGSASVMGTIGTNGMGSITYELPNAIHPGGTLELELSEDTADPVTYVRHATLFFGSHAVSSTEPTFGITNVELKEGGSGAVVVTVSRTDSHGARNTFSNLMVTVQATSGNGYITGNDDTMMATFANQSTTSTTVEFPRAADVDDTVEAVVVDIPGYGVMQQPDNPPDVVTSLEIRTTPASSDADLSALSVSAGTLSPTFPDPDTTMYTADVAAPVGAVVITLAAHAAASVAVTVKRGEAAAVPVTSVTPGSYTISNLVAAVAGATNVVTITVTAEDGTTNPNPYTVTITRAASTNASLRDLSLSDGLTLNRPFFAGTTSYTVAAGADVTMATITLSTQHPAASVVVTSSAGTVSGGTITGGTGSTTVSGLTTGDTTVTLTVTAEDTTSMETYTVTISVAGITSDGVASLSVTEGASVTYTLVLNTQPTHAVTIALGSDDTSAVTVTPSISFSTTDWNSAKTVTVTGVEDGDTVGESVSISYSVTSTDTAYNGFSLAAQPVSVTDDDLAGAGVTSSQSGALALMEGGSAGTYTLVLAVEPTGTVTIDLTSDDNTSVTATPTISFDASDWNTMKTVTVTAVEDGDTVGENVTISYAISGGGYDLATLTDQSVTVTDNDLAATAGITSDGVASLSVTEGASVTYTLVLNTQPTHAVTIALGSDDTSAVTVTASISFSTTDWNSPKTVTVTGVEDGDTVGESVSISYSVTSTDTDYNGFSLTAQSVTVDDDDLVGAVVTSSQSGALALMEEGSVGTYTLVLAIEPTGTVTIDLSSDDTTSVTVTPTISFDASDWSNPKTVTVTAVDDADMVSETVSISYAISGGGYDLATLGAQSVTVTDNDIVTAGVTSSQSGALALTEGGSAGTYTLVLNTQPTHAVTIALGSDDTSAVTVTASISFSTTDWNSPKTVTVTGVEDGDTVGESVSISYSVTSTDTDYNGFSLTAQSVTVDDDDLVGAVVTSSQSGALALMEEGSVGTYTLVLAIEPTGTVTIDLSSDDTTSVTVTPTISFDASDWSNPKTVTVTAVDDADMVSETVTISYAISGGGYDLATLGAQSVTVTDNDIVTAGVTSSQSGALALTEGGSAGTYTLVLDTQPTGTVTITLTSDDTGAVTVNSPITFDATDWNTMKTVTVTVEDDADATDESVTITYGISGGGYGSVTLAAQSVTVDDDETATPAGVTSSQSGALALTEGGSAGTYTLVLNTQPTGTVTITLTSSDTGAVTVNSPISFDATDWNTTKTVTVTVVDDADATDESVTITYGISGGGYGAVTLMAQSVTVDDDETATPAGITSSQSGTLALTEGGSAGTYTLVLDTQPTGTVTITLTSDDTGAVTVNSPLTFDATDWNTTKTVTVTVVDDADATDESVTITYGISGGGYGSVTLMAQSVTVDDDETPVTAGITSSQSGALALTEGGSAGTYTLVLDTQPTGTVTITLTSDDTGAVTVNSPITFDATDWNTMKTVTVTVVDDADATDESVTITYGISGGGYGSVTLMAQSVTVDDDETPVTAGVTSSQSGALALTEGGSAGTYTLVLDTQPTGTVTITLTSSDTGAVTVNSPITFDATDWNTTKTVTVTVVDDADATDESVTITYGISGGGYGSVTLMAQSVTVDDDETPVTAGITSSQSGALSLTEGGSAGSYTLVLDTQPTGTVTITLTSSDTGAVTVTSPITFDATDWNTTKTVTVTVVDDADATDESVTITYGISGGGYGSVTLMAQSVTVDDDETATPAGITSSQSGALALTEGGSAGTYTLVLDTQPTGTVTITLTSSDTGAVTVNSPITFDATDWNTTKTVTVTVVDDADATDESVTITYGISGGGYGSVTLTAQSVTVDDDETATPAGVTSSQSGALALTEGGSAGTYTLVLDTQPTGTVTITLTSSDTGAVTVNSPLTFDATDWSSTKTVTVTVVDDADATDESVTISYGISGGGYGSVTLMAQSVTVDDDETPVTAGVTSSQSGALSLTEGGSAGTYTLVLDTQPTGTVTITLTSSDTGAVTVTPTISFDATDWNTMKTVTVTVVDDANATDESVTITYGISGGGYDAVTLAAQSVIVDDDETVGVTSTGAASISVTEGASVTYTLVLTAQPTGPVMIALVSGDTTSVTVTSTVSFSTTDWNTAKTVTVTGVEDADVAGESVTISYGISGGGYDGVTLAAQSVVVIDNDSAPGELPAFQIESITSSEIAANSPLRQSGLQLLRITISRVQGSGTAAATVRVAVSSSAGLFMPAPDETPNVYLVRVSAGQSSTGILDLTSTRAYRPGDSVTATIMPPADGSYQVVNTPGVTTSQRVVLAAATAESRTRDVKQALGGYASTVGWDIVEGVRERVSGAGRSGDTGSSVDISGVMQFVESEAAARGWQYEAEAGNPYTALPAAAGDGGLDDSGISIWANAKKSDVSVSASPGLIGLSGDMISGRIGIETDIGDDDLVGVAVSYLGGDVDFTGGSAGRGRVELSQLSLHPYVVYSFDDVRLWGTAGLGNGTMDYSEVRDGTTVIGSSRVWMNTVAGGAEYDIVSFDSLELTGRMEAMTTELRARGDSSGNNSIYRGNNARVHGARGEFEMGWPVDGEVLRFRPFATLGYRWDGGDIESSGAAEYGGGVSLGTDNFSFEALARAQSSSDEYKRTSYSVSMSYDSGNDRLGLNLGVRNELGISRSSSSNVFAGAVPGVGDSSTETMVLGVDAGYGFAVGGSGLLKPYFSTEFGNSASGRMNLGISLDDGPVSFDLTHTFQKSSGSSADAESEFTLSGSVRF